VRVLTLLGAWFQSRGPPSGVELLLEVPEREIRCFPRMLKMILYGIIFPFLEMRGRINFWRCRWDLDGFIAFVLNKMEM